MSKVYQPKSNQLPHNLYMFIIYTIKDYSRMKRTYRALDPGADPDYKHELERQIAAIERALLEVPEDIRTDVLLNITDEQPRRKDIPIRLFKYYKQKLITDIAANLRLR